MFEDCDAAHNTCVRIDSTWKSVRSGQVREVQTDPRTSADVGVQSRHVADVDTQTVAPPAVNDEDLNPLKDPKFYKFLQRAVPLLEKELNLAARSRAFDGYKVSEETSDREALKLHTLDGSSSAASASRQTVNKRGTAKSDAAEVDPPARVSHVAWSTTGSNVATCYEHEEHENWCDHATHVHLWNLRRRNFDPSHPQLFLLAQSCLSVVEFHPTDPSLLAGAGHTGEIFIWNTSGAETSGAPLNPVATSGGFSLSGHRGKVTGLHWALGSDVLGPATTRQVLLASAGLDGRMILWDQDPKALRWVKKMSLTAGHLATRIRSTTDVAITASSVSRHDGVTVLLGTESGVLFQAALDSRVPLDPEKLASAEIADDGEDWLDPVKAVLGKHAGKILDIKFSPFNSQTFLSLGSDQEVRIYSLLQPLAPIKIVHATDRFITQIAWSPSRPLVFGATSKYSKLLIFDLRFNESVLELKSSEKQQNVHLSCLEFNKSDFSLIAGGDCLGQTHVWKLPDHLTSLHPKELEILNTLINLTKD